MKADFYGVWEVSGRFYGVAWESGMVLFPSGEMCWVEKKPQHGVSRKGLWDFKETGKGTYLIWFRYDIEEGGGRVLYESNSISATAITNGAYKSSGTGYAGTWQAKKISDAQSTDLCQPGHLEEKPAGEPTKTPAANPDTEEPAK